MNYLPLNFYDEVIHRLDKYDIVHLKLILGYWSSTAETNLDKRRQLTLFLKSNSEDNKVGFKVFSESRPVPFEIDFKYDRVESIDVLFTPEETEEVTREQFRTETLPTIRSSASNCTLDVFLNTSHSNKLCDIIFDGLKGLSDIAIDDYGEKSHEFIRRQIELGNLKTLDLSENTTWPADFQDLIKVFVKSPKFRILSIEHSNLRLDLNMVTCVFDRFFNGELTNFYLRGSPPFPLNRFRYLYPQFAVIPDDWPTPWTTVVWQEPLREKMLAITISDTVEEIEIYCR